MTRRLTYLTWGVTLLVLSALLCLSFQEPRGQLRRLPDGTTVELAAVTFGREHRYQGGNLWQRLWALRYPRVYPPNPLETDEDEAVLWFNWHGPCEFQQAGTVDEHGCYLHPSASVYPMAPLSFGPRGRSIAKGPPTFAFTELPAYPRRTGHFRLQLFDNPLERRPTAEFDVRQRPVRPVQEWQGQRLPLTARDGGVEFVMDQLRHEASPEMLGWASAVFRCREAGKLSHDWIPEQITVADVTGNSLTTSADANGSDRQQFRGLCRREPAWKVQVGFVRSKPLRSTAAFVWQAPPLTAPAKDHTGGPSSSIRHGEVTLGIKEISGGGTATGETFDAYQRPTVTLSISAPDSRYSVGVIAAADESGRPLEVEPSAACSLGPGDCLYDFRLRFRPRTRQVRLTLGLFETHTAEFLVKP